MTRGSAEPSRSAASIAWAIATIVVALVAGALIYVSMTTDSEPGAAGPTGTIPSPAPTTTTPQAVPPPTTALPPPPPPTTQPPPPDATTGPTSTALKTLTPEQIDYLMGLQRREADDPLAKGAVDAPVVLIEYADYRCPFCASWSKDEEPQLADLVEDGTLRIEFRDVILFGAESEATAVAARAAGEQGMYWEYHRAIFEAAPSGGHPDMPRAKLVGFAEQIGVPDLAKFEADLDSPALKAAVAADGEEAKRLGIRSTPTFLVNTTPVVGAQPAAIFRHLIEQEADKATATSGG